MIQPKAKSLIPDPMLDLPEFEDSYIEQLLKTDLRHIFDVMAGVAPPEPAKEEEPAPVPLPTVRSA